MAEPITLRTGSEAAGQRLDAFLAGAVPELTRSAAQRLIGEGQVLVNGRAPAKSLKLSGGETVTVILPEPEPIEAVAQDIPLDVVYEDEDVIVVNKPVGLVVHPPPATATAPWSTPCSTTAAAASAAWGAPAPRHRPPHRPGHQRPHHRRQERLRPPGPGRPAPGPHPGPDLRGGGGGELSGGPGHRGRPIGRCPSDRKKMAVVDRGGRSAVTHWEVVERFPGYTHIRCRLETGRTHQIRVHMACIGHPLLGDTVYGAKKPVPGLAGQCLHAAELRFLHPRTGER